MPCIFELPDQVAGDGPAPAVAQTPQPYQLKVHSLVHPFCFVNVGKGWYIPKGTT